jgi:hypothetical protein
MRSVIFVFLTALLALMRMTSATELTWDNVLETLRHIGQATETRNRRLGEPRTPGKEKQAPSVLTFGGSTRPKKPASSLL